MLILRCRRNEATGSTPSKLVLGYDLPQFGEWNIPNYAAEREVPVNRENLIDQAHQHQTAYRHKYAPDQVAPVILFRPGQRVIVRTFERKTIFSPPWRGPYLITRKISDEIYEVDKDGILSLIHTDDLRPAPEGNDRFEWEDDTENSDDLLNQDIEVRGNDEPEASRREVRETALAPARNSPEPRPSTSSPAHDYQVISMPPSTRMPLELIEEPTSGGTSRPQTSDRKSRTSAENHDLNTEEPVIEEDVPTPVVESKTDSEPRSTTTSHQHRTHHEDQGLQPTTTTQPPGRRRRRSRMVIRDRLPNPREARRESAVKCASVKRAKPRPSARVDRNTLPVQRTLVFKPRRERFESVR